jgi:hypothetical protein
MNIVLPACMAAGAAAGWAAASPSGTICGVLAGVAGLVLAIPSCGLVVDSVAVVLFLVERLTGGRPRAEDGE